MKSKLTGFSYLLLFFFMLGTLNSCKKTINTTAQGKPEEMSLSQKTTSHFESGESCYEPLESTDFTDSEQRPTILGYQLVNNPYSVANMQQASISIYGTSDGIQMNKRYVRFKPANEEQLQQLIDTDIELFDYPLDYDVVQEGDYYDQGLPASEIPWYYSVVEPSFVSPAGIQYEVLADLHVPDNDIYLEDYAFLITGNPIDGDCSQGMSSSNSSCEQQVCQEENTHWDYTVCACVPDAECPPGYHFDWYQQTCIPNTPPPPPPGKRPAGQILVRDNTLNAAGGGDPVAVRRTRVVMRRWFKIDRTFTDDDGRFSSSKHYRNKVNILVKFKSQELTVRGLRGARFYQMYFPIKQGIGKYSGNLNNVTHIFEEGTDFAKRTYRNWWGAQCMNAYVEYNAGAAALQTGTIPGNMQVLLTNLGGASGAGSTPMNAHRPNSGTPAQEWISFFIADPQVVGSDAANVFNYLSQGVLLRTFDMTLGYNVSIRWRSDRVKALMYHEMSHAAHFNKVGANWWNSFVYAEEVTILHHNGANDPYGDGNDGISSEYISVGESWAEHMARTMCDRHYGANSTQVGKQGFAYVTGGQPNPSLTSHLNALEDFDPNRPVANDPFRWIPEGIFYDLIDILNEANPIIDGVSNFTNQQIFNALDGDVRSMPQYRERLIAENPGNQTNEVRNLFALYHY